MSRPNSWLENALRFFEKLIPKPLYRFGQPIYHYCLALLGAALYRFPSRKLTVIAVTGTKGKTSTTEIIAHLLRESGARTASASTIQFVAGEEVQRNLYKMTIPGRFFLQRFLRRAVSAGCTHAVIELSSEGVLQFRHKWVALDALVFTNVAPEHIERHGSFENYLEAKLELARSVARSPKRPRILVANLDDAQGKRFLEPFVEIKKGYGLKDAEPYSADDKSVRFVWQGQVFAVPLPGLFNLYNCLAALTLGEALGLDKLGMKHALERIPPIAGRAERVECGQPFDVVVDYAHTPESLQALYETFKSKRIVGVLGSMGGGRDAWKHDRMGALADHYCDTIFLTEEDPYDDDPEALLARTAKGFARHKPHLIQSRRAAIHEALKAAKRGDAVLITGKGTDPYIMRAKGQKEPWSDRKVAQEELQKLGYH